MIILTRHRIAENGEKFEVDINLFHITFVSERIVKDSDSKELKQLVKNTCVIALSNGTAMWIDFPRDKLRKMMTDYK